MPTHHDPAACTPKAISQSFHRLRPLPWQAVASQQQLKPDLEQQGVDFAAVHDQLRSLCRTVLTAAATQVLTRPIQIQP